MENTKYFDDLNIITARPEGMDYTEYKQRMKAQKKVIKQYLKGEIIHLSKLYKSSAVLAHFGLKPNATSRDIYLKSLEPGNESAMLLLRGFTYVKQ